MNEGASSLLYSLFYFNLFVRVGGREVKTGQEVRDAVRETSENGEIRCRFLRRHVEGEDTWIDIANNREVWTDLVYELFHNAKDY